VGIIQTAPKVVVKVLLDAVQWIKNNDHHFGPSVDKIVHDPLL
jgi:hypothetical protein